MKVLLSAYACEPGAGSEPGVGWRALQAAASRHEVWLLTRENNAAAIESALKSAAFNDRVHVHAFDVPGRAFDRKRRGLLALHRYYDVWQQRAADEAMALHRQVRFDVVHHATFATYWTRAGVAAVDAPLVVGPVGGGVEAPGGLLPILGVRGLGEEVMRTLGRRMMSSAVGGGRYARRAALVFAQNPETAARLDVGGELRYLPNATAVDFAYPDVPPERVPEVIVAGRLIPWKGATLAVRAAAMMDHPVPLRIYGDGPDVHRVMDLVRRFGIESRVDPPHRKPRSELIRAIAATAVVLHPAIHDESPLSVAETLALQTPLVALDWGGPSVLVRTWPASPATLVRPSSVEKTALGLAAAADTYIDSLAPIPGKLAAPSVTFAEALLDGYGEVAGR